MQWEGGRLGCLGLGLQVSRWSDTEQVLHAAKSVLVKTAVQLQFQTCGKKCTLLPMVLLIDIVRVSLWMAGNQLLKDLRVQRKAQKLSLV